MALYRDWCHIYRPNVYMYTYRTDKVGEKFVDIPEIS